jgi:hypothetical protein
VRARSFAAHRAATVKELDAFLADTSEGAYEKALDRLLESPHYGERWGRHWLDVAGYAESEGNGNDDTPRALETWAPHPLGKQDILLAGTRIERIEPVLLLPAVRQTVAVGVERVGALRLVVPHRDILVRHDHNIAPLQRLRHH